MTTFILDVETTDKDPAKCEVVEFAWKEFHFGTEIANFGLRRFSHSGGMRFGALAAHHILPEEMVGAPRYSGEYLPDITARTYWVGHNVDFDWECLGKPAVKRVCTLAMARRIWPTLDSHSLSALTYFTQGATKEVREKLRGAHSALADVNLCEELLVRMCKEANLQTIEELHSFSEVARIPTVMTFGKFAGEPIAKVDRGYANWYRKQPNPDPYLLEAFRRNGLM